MGKAWSKKEGERENRSDASQELLGWAEGAGAKKINMVLNIHYLSLSVGWEAPRGDFSCDEVVMFFFFLPSIV